MIFSFLFRSTNDLLKALQCESLCTEDEMQKGGRAGVKQIPPQLYGFTKSSDLLILISLRINV